MEIKTDLWTKKMALELGAMLPSWLIHQQILNGDEIFEPVAIIEPFDEFHKAIEKVNDSRFGLQVGIFTNDMSNFQGAMNGIEVGGLIMNDVPGFRMDSTPYGGIEASGLGREGLKYATRDMSEEKLIVF